MVDRTKWHGNESQLVYSYAEEATRGKLLHASNINQDSDIASV